MAKKIRHIASGREMEVPDAVFRLGGDAMTRWCDAQLAEEQLANDKAELERLELIAQQEQAREAKDLEIAELKQLVTNVVTQNESLQKQLGQALQQQQSVNYEKQSELVARNTDLLSRLTLKAAEIEAKHGEGVMPAEEGLRAELEAERERNRALVENNRRIFAEMRAKQVATGHGDDTGLTTDDIEAYG